MNGESISATGRHIREDTEQGGRGENSKEQISNESEISAKTLSSTVSERI